MSEETTEEVTNPVVETPETVAPVEMPAETTPTEEKAE